MIERPDNYSALSVMDQARHREVYERPLDQARSIRYSSKVDLMDADGNKHSVILGRVHSGVHIFRKDPEGHPEDWKWVNPVINEFVALGNAKALNTQTDFKTYHNAKITRLAER